MGYSTAYSLATDAHLSLEDAISMHFSSNCYPPIPQFMVKCAVEAVLSASADDWYNEIELPEGVTHRLGKTQVTAAEIIENCRLEAFVMEDGEGDC